MSEIDPIALLKKYVSESSPFLKRYHEGLKADLEFASGGPAQYVGRDSSVLGSGKSGIVFNFMGRYCEDITNQYRRKPYGIMFSARKASAKEQATTLNGLVKGWMSVSDFASATISAVDRQVKCGMGYVKLSNEYESESEGFEQRIAITALMRPDMVLFDPYSTVTDGSDAKKCAIVEHISLDAALEMGVEEDDCKDITSPMDGSTWQSPEGYVPLVTFYVMDKKTSKIYQNGMGETITEGKEKELKKMKSRSVQKSSCTIYRIIGTKVIDQTTLELSRIPIIPFRGKLVDRNNRQEWVGEVHDGRDPSKLINYSANLSVERIAMAPKATRYVDMKSIAPYLQTWQKSNKIPVPFLPYNSKVGDEQFNAPVSDTPNIDLATPATAQANGQSVLASILGSNEAGSMHAGASNETAAAVLTRSNSTENAKFVYADNASKSVKAIGRVWLEMAGIVYDTQRVLPMCCDGEMDMEEVNFSDIGMIPSEIDVSTESGPLSDTQRKESLGALIALGSMLGPDAALVFASDIAKNCDFEDSENVATKLAAYSMSKNGIGGKANTEQDPEAIKALEMASQAHDALQAQLDQANAYIQQLQMQNYVSEQGFEIDRETALINAENRLNVEAMKQQGSLTKQQLQIQADARAEVVKQQAEVEKTFASQPKITVVHGLRPDYNTVGGMSNAQIS